jgi:hypothetical protein
LSQGIILKQKILLRVTSVLKIWYHHIMLKHSAHNVYKAKYNNTASEFLTKVYKHQSPRSPANIHIFC